MWGETEDNRGLARTLMVGGLIFSGSHRVLGQCWKCLDWDDFTSSPNPKLPSPFQEVSLFGKEKSHLLPLEKGQLTNHRQHYLTLQLIFWKMEVHFEWTQEVLICSLCERLENALQVAIIRIKDPKRLSSIKLFLIPYPTCLPQMYLFAIIQTSLKALNYSLFRVFSCPLLSPSRQGICLIHFLFCNLYVPGLTSMTTK